MRLLIIRPQPASDRSALAARGAGFTAETLPLFEVAAMPWIQPDPHAFDGLLISSANVLRHGGAKLIGLRDLPVLAIGEATANRAREQGFKVAVTGTRDKAALLLHAKNCGFKRLLWLAGQHRTAAAPDENIIAERITIYESHELPLPTDFSESLARCDAVLLHSPRAAVHFGISVDEGGAQRRDISLVALSPAVAEAAGEGWRIVAVADAPSEDALLLAAQSVAT